MQHLHLMPGPASPLSLLCKIWSRSEKGGRGRGGRLGRCELACESTPAGALAHRWMLPSELPWEAGM